MAWNGTPTPAIRRKSNGRWPQRNAIRKAGRRQTMSGFPVDAKAFSAAEIAAYFTGDRIVCLLCGKKYRKLAVHLHRIHAVKTDEYKARYGLPWGRGLSCGETRQIHADLTRHRIEDGWDVAGYLASGRAKILTEKPRERPRTPARKAQTLSLVLGLTRAGKFFEESDFEAVITEIEAGRSPIDVCTETGRPSRGTFRKWLREHPAFFDRYCAAVEALPFPEQAKSQSLGKRFDVEVRGLFDQGASDHQIASKLGVTAMTVNQRTKPWRLEPRPHLA